MLSGSLKIETSKKRLFITIKFFDQNKLIVNWQCESLADTLVYINAKENRLTPIRLERLPGPILNV